MKMLLMAPALMIGVNVATVLILYNGGNMVLRGELEVGQLSSIITYIFNILFSVMMVGMALLQLTRARACADRIFEVLDTEPSIEDGKSAAEPADVKGLVEFRNVSFKYQAAGTGDDVLRNISFTAKPGQTVAIVGGTGVGKSTLVNLIPRFYDVTGGEILLDGRDVRDYALDDLRGRIGMVLQNNVLFSGTIRENLLWGNPDATEEEIIQAAKDAQAYDFIMSFPDGLDTHIDQGGVNVSGGQKQRLCIARAMLRRPEVLILDDSTSAVDSTTEADETACPPRHRPVLCDRRRPQLSGRNLLHAAHYQLHYRGGEKRPDRLARPFDLHFAAAGGLCHCGRLFLCPVRPHGPAGPAGVQYPAERAV